MESATRRLGLEIYHARAGFAIPPPSAEEPPPLENLCFCDHHLLILKLEIQGNRLAAPSPVIDRTNTKRLVAPVAHDPLPLRSIPSIVLETDLVGVEGNLKITRRIPSDEEIDFLVGWIQKTKKTNLEGILPCRVDPNGTVPLRSYSLMTGPPQAPIEGIAREPHED